MKYVGPIVCLAAMTAGAVLSSLLFLFVVWFHPNKREYARAVDQMVNAAVFMGEARESLSSHSWRAPMLGMVKFIDFFLGDGHCKEAYKHEKKIVEEVQK